MNTKYYWFVISAIIMLVLIGLIAHYLNKDYKLNGTKRWMTTSKYGRIVWFCSIILLTVSTQLIDEVIDSFFPEYSTNLGLDLLHWFVSLIISFIIVASVFVWVRANYFARKKFEIKDDENDVIPYQEKKNER